MSDWTGNGKAITATNCATTRGNVDRQAHDFYATDPKAVYGLLHVMRGEFAERILEPCAGAGHITSALVGMGHKVTSEDLFPSAEFVNRADFMDRREWDGDIVTNPPYAYSLKFAEHALAIVRDGAKVAFFLPLRWLASSGRREFFKTTPPRNVLVFSTRVGCAKNGDFAHMGGNAVDYAWFVWQKGFAGKPSIDWIDPEDCR